jgi:hypothetical protein
MWSKEPTYREAYPKFEFFAAMRAWKGGSPLCEYYDERGCRIGDLLIERVTKAYLQVSYMALASDQPFEARRDSFAVRPAPNPVDPNRMVLGCFACGRRVRALYLRGSWRCAACHQLTFRDRLLQPATRAWERHDHLSKLIGRGRPKYMRQAEYSRLVEELKSLKSITSRAVVCPSVVHSREVSGTWMPVSAADPDYKMDFETATTGHVRNIRAPEAPVVPAATPLRGAGRMDPTFFEGNTGPSPWFEGS